MHETIQVQNRKKNEFMKTVQANSIELAGGPHGSYAIFMLKKSRKRSIK